MNIFNSIDFFQFISIDLRNQIILKFKTNQLNRKYCKLIGLRRK